MKKLYAALLLLCSFTLLNAQTFVNRQFIDTIGHLPAVFSNVIGIRDTGGGFIAGVNYLDNTFESFSAAKLLSNGDPAWVTGFEGDDTTRIFGTSVYYKSGYDYYTGFSYDSTHSRAKIKVWKISDATGDTAWTADYNGGYNGYAAASSILADDSGNVYVAGTEQAGSLDFRMTVLKYDQNGNRLWVGSYDSTGMYNGAVAMVLDEGKYIIATGFSGSGFGSWDFVTVKYHIGTGHVEHVARSSNGSGAFSQPVGIAKDLDHNTYISGTSAISGGLTTIKTIKYDSLFNEIWVQTWADSGLSAEAADMKITPFFEHIVITGTRHKANGGEDMVTIMYNDSGTLQWARTIAANNPTSAASSRSVAVTNEPAVYITGSVFNGTDSDVVTTSYDMNGNIRWMKTYQRAPGSNDYPNIVLAGDDGSVGVALTSKGADSLYLFVQYEQWADNNPLVLDTDSIPMYIDHELVIKFDPAIVNKEFVNDKEREFSELKDIAPDSVITEMAGILGLDYKDLIDIKIKKIFIHMTIADSISISRLRDTIKMPEFWSAFIIELPNGIAPDSSIIDSLSTLCKEIVSTEPVFVGTLTNVSNDSYISTRQASLVPDGNSTFNNANINIDPAWDIETGKSYVKVGVFDYPIYWGHEDFGDGTFAGSKIAGGWDYASNTSISQISNPGNSHGTAVAGIIGALRNNNIGTAGIAGGDVANGNTGCQIFSMGIEWQSGNGSIFILLPVASNAIIEGAAYNPTTGFGYGLNIQNHSWKSNKPSTLLKSALRNCNQNQCSFIASRGNDGNAALLYPACYDDNLVVCVGASGWDGQWKNIANGDFWWSSSWGNGVDLIAPGTREIITSLINPNWPINNMNCTNIIYPNNYECFNGTSAAAPHVSGTAALMMSRHNINQGYTNNLSPDDVENLLKRYATDCISTALGYGAGYDPYTGWGLLNAGAVMDAINAPKYSIFHSGIPQSSTVSTVLTGTSILLAEPYNNMPPGLYTGDVYSLSQSYSDVFSSTTQILNYWPRLSSTIGTSGNWYPTVGFPQGNYSFSITGNTASVSGLVFAFHLLINRAPFNNPIDVWIPDNISNLKTAYSLQLYDPSATDLKELGDNIDFSIYPNPTCEKLSASIVIPQKESINIQILDISGRVLYNQEFNSADHFLATFMLDKIQQGLYFCKVSGENIYHVKKFIKN